MSFLCPPFFSFVSYSSPAIENYTFTVGFFFLFLFAPVSWHRRNLLLNLLPSWSVFLHSQKKTLQDDCVENNRMFHICIQIDGKLYFHTETYIAFFTNIYFLAWPTMLLRLFFFFYLFAIMLSHTFNSSAATWISAFPPCLISFPVTLSVLTTNPRAKRVVSPLPGESILTLRINTLTGYCFPRQVTEL